MKVKVELTQKQAENILWCLGSGYQVLQEFLRHDEWDCEMTKKEKYNSMQNDRLILKAIQTLKDAMHKSEVKL